MCVYVYTDTGATHTQTLTVAWTRLATCLTLPLPPFLLLLFRLCFYAAVATSSPSLSSSPPLLPLFLFILFFYTAFSSPSLPLLLRPLQQSCLHKVFF